MEADLGELNLDVYPESVVESEGETVFLAREGGTRLLGIRGRGAGFEGRRQGDFLFCPLNATNAAALRHRLNFLRPQPLGLALSAGFGDRLGLATPGHVQALRAVPGILPILAQQSMRENARTGRTPQQVLDEAMWGVFETGWTGPWGADADHLKSADDIDLCVQAGYTFFTFDPGAHVDNEAHGAAPELLQAKYAALPWTTLEDTPQDMERRYRGREFPVEGIPLVFLAPALWQAAAKYGRALAHVAGLYRHLASRMADRPFEVEISVDETETPTSPEEHFFIATELRRLGVDWVSLAPRYLGRFEKGVDFIGDLAAFEADFARHAAIARALGPYKLSLHSGSDKFSIYPIAARQAGERVHLKTAGTSYLEALRVVAQARPELFRAILALAIDRYPQDRASYHVSAAVERIPAPESLADTGLPEVLDQFDTREALHVTFGSALETYGDELKAALRAHEEAYYAVLQRHFERHLAPFGNAKRP